MPSALPFDNSYARLPDRFHARVAPTPTAAPRLIALNVPLAEELGLDPDWLRSPEGLAMLAGQSFPHGAEPIAQAYAGHQFGNFVPQLGDGRALLLGEVVARNGRRYDIQLKGSGPTPFSRRGDGRSALGPVLREYLVSEAMAAMGIPTTRALAACVTGDVVLRERPLPGAVLTRVASSHIRVGTFQYFAARQDIEGLRLLADHVIDRHYPAARTAANPALSLIDHVIAAQASLVARWLCVGFIHGVMNTDNCSVAGETIDFGPCAFMDRYDPHMVFSSIDRQGRYAYANQPHIALWNLTRLAETLLPLIADDQAQAIALAEDALRAFAPQFEAAYTHGMVQKIGLTEVRADDDSLVNDLLDLMTLQQIDFTLFFRALCDDVLLTDGDSSGPARALFAVPEAFDGWATRWRARLLTEVGDAATRRAAMQRVNPAFIPRNHRIEQVIEAAVARDDFGPFHALHAVLARPFDDQPEMAHYMTPPDEDEIVRQTFCGT